MGTCQTTGVCASRSTSVSYTHLNSIERNSQKVIKTNVSRQSEHIKAILDIHYGYLRGIAKAVSYTHLDVYKRQYHCPGSSYDPDPAMGKQPDQRN